MTVRARLIEELDKLGVPVGDHLDLTAWLCGLERVPNLSALSVGECATVLERLANVRDSAKLLSEWRTARAQPEPDDGEEWLANPGDEWVRTQTRWL